jgi:hypothetical protein
LTRPFRLWAGFLLAVLRGLPKSYSPKSIIICSTPLHAAEEEDWYRFRQGEDCDRQTIWASIKPAAKLQLDFVTRQRWRVFIGIRRLS